MNQNDDYDAYGQYGCWWEGDTGVGPDGLQCGECYPDYEEKCPFLKERRLRAELAETMSRDKPIEEMTCKDSCVYAEMCYRRGVRRVASPKECPKFKNNTDYRKKSEVIDEFVKLLKDTSMTKYDYHEAVDIDEIDRIAAKMKGEAE